MGILDMLGGLVAPRLPGRIETTCCKKNFDCYVLVSIRLRLSPQATQPARYGC